MNKQKLKIVLAGIIGNALEIYDFALYGAFASIIATAFFPKTDPIAALFASLVIFSVGFLMRPIGALIFGYLGDRWGRKRALTWSITCMAVPTVIIGILPSYEQIGIVSTLLLTLCRLIQGLCAGGEFTGASIYVMEHTLPNRRGLMSGLIVSSSTLGALLATFLGYIVLSTSQATWMWRIPFLLGGLVGLIGIYIRRRLDESPEYIAFKNKMTTADMETYVPLKEVIIKHPRALLNTIGIGAFGTVISYTLTVYMNIYLNKEMGFSLSQSMLYSSLGLIIYFFSSILTGYLSDFFGQKKVMTIMASLAFMTFYPLFLLVQTGVPSNILIAQMLLGFLAGGFCGPETTLMNHLFPVQSRYTGASFGYCFGLTLMGGTLPLFASYLIVLTGNTMAPAYYLMFGAVIGLIAVVTSRELSRPITFSR